MPRPVYRNGETYVVTLGDLIYFSTHPEKDSTLDTYKLALVRAVRDQITLRQLKCMDAYYVRKMSMLATAKMLDINESTVSRNIKRGRAETGLADPAGKGNQPHQIRYIKMKGKAVSRKYIAGGAAVGINNIKGQSETAVLFAGVRRWWGECQMRKT